MADPQALIDRLTAAQNAHDLEGMLACFHEDYRGTETPGRLPDRYVRGQESQPCSGTRPKEASAGPESRAVA